jgi:aminoglycoside 6'-N-acetyltransferase
MLRSAARLDDAASTREDGAMSEPNLAGQRVVLRPARIEDRPRLREILAQPEIARWWGPGGPDHAVDEWLDTDDGAVFAIEFAGVLVGSIEYAEENDPDYRHAGIDLFLDTAHQGHGLGSDALRTLARYLLEVRGHHRLTIDPAAANERAIRAYRPVGFSPVGVMRAYERGQDGSWHDGLMLDLLAGDLT